MPIDPNFVPDNDFTPDENFIPDQNETAPPQNESFLRRAWDAISEPMVNIREQSPQLKAGTDLIAQQHPWIGKPMNFGLDTLSGLTSPLNVGTTAAFGGSNLAMKAGLPEVARGLNLAGRAASVPTVVEGAKHLGEHPLIGGLEIAGGLAGMRTKLPEIGGPHPNMEGMNFDDLTNEHFPQRDIAPEMSIAPRFNPRHVKGLTNIKELADGTVVNIKTGEVLEPEVTLKTPTKQQVTDLRNKGYVPAGTTEEGYPKMKLGMPEEANVIRGTKSPPEPAHFDAEGKFMGDRLPEVKEEPIGKLKEAYNLSRGMSTTFDLSAPGRQGLPLITTKAWWGAWDDMLKSWGSEKAYRNVQDNILQRPLFKRALDAQGKELNSFAEQSGLALTDLGSLTKREEALMSNWAEKMPALGGTIRRSNRAYTAFLNQLRADHFEKLINDAHNIGLDPKHDLNLSGQIADFVNNATGRGSLKFHAPFKTIDLERNAKLLNNTFFAPRLMASRMAMLNPANYVMQPSFVRQQYLKAALSTASVWGGMATLAKFAGADVGTDSTSADFGKVKLGNTRLDAGGGFQQYLVALSRFIQGKTTSSTTENTRNFGEGYNAPTRGSSIAQFMVNKTHPMVHLAYDLANASQYKPFSVGDQTIKLFAPMIASDIIQLVKEDPKLVPWLAPLIAVGMGTQTYDEKGQGQPILPEGMDVNFTGGPLGESFERSGR